MYHAVFLEACIVPVCTKETRFGHFADRRLAGRGGFVRRWARAREEWAHRFFSGGGTRTTFPSGAAATCLREENTRWMDRASSYVPCLGSCVCVGSLWGLSNNIRLLDDRHPARTRTNAGAGMGLDSTGKMSGRNRTCVFALSLLDGRH